jgi:hypothetical protein
MNNKKKTMKIIFYPEKHTQPDKDKVSQLIEDAKAGKIHLALEDHALYMTLSGYETIYSLEGTNLLTIDHLLSMLVWMLDTKRETIQELKHEGVLLFCVYTYVCGQLQLQSVLPQCASLNVPDCPKCLSEIVAQVKKNTISSLGGIPGNAQIGPIREHVLGMIQERTTMDVLEYSIYHGVILREQKMAQAMIQTKAQVLHVIIGANHITKLLSNEDLKNLSIKVGIHAFRRLERLADKFYPNERLTDLLQDFEVCVL